MNDLYDRIRPADEHLDPATAQRVWARISNEPAGSPLADPDLTEGSPDLRLEAGPEREHPRRVRRAATWAAAAAAVIGLAGIAVVAGRPGSETPAATPAQSNPPGTTLNTELDLQVPMRPAPTCADGDQTEVPNVAGMAYPAAVDTLLANGLSFEVMRETPPEGETTTDDTYTVVDQDTTPGDIVACGTEVRITAAWRPGKLHTVEPGDTWDSIAAAQDIPVEDLLGFNGFTIAELETAGESTTSPLEVGRAISLTPNTVPTPTS